MDGHGVLENLRIAIEELMSCAKHRGALSRPTRYSLVHLRQSLRMPVSEYRDSFHMARSVSMSPRRAQRLADKLRAP